MVAAAELVRDWEELDFEVRFDLVICHQHEQPESMQVNSMSVVDTWIWNNDK